MNRDVEVIDRSVFNLFQFLGDIGGFYGIIFGLSATLNSYLNF